MKNCSLVSGFVLLMALVRSAFAISVPSDGSDGAFTPASSVQIDLSQAATGSWDQPSPKPGAGVYDPEKWAVVFKFASVDIPQNVTVTFKNHPSFPPVVWLVQGNVRIKGSVLLDGQSGSDIAQPPPFSAEPGPGGFASGSVKLATDSPPTSGGFPRGPGSKGWGDNAVYAQSWPALHMYAYGNEAIVPLIGGSGGGPDGNRITGGGGGGAILIAAGGSVAVEGFLRADGGAGGGGYAGYGSGGGIRIVAENVEGTGSLRAKGAYVGDGRIRIESNDYTQTLLCQPVASVAPIGKTVRIWPESTLPSIRVVSMGGEAVPEDPRTRVRLGDAAIVFPQPGQKAVLVETRNVPLDWVVTVRAPTGAGGSSATATHVAGTVTLSTWEATLNMDSVGFYFVQAHAAPPVQ